MVLMATQPCRQTRATPQRGAAALSQRRCACGRHTPAGAACRACRQPSTRQTESATRDAPPIVREVLQAPGSPIEADARAFLNPRFGHDFSGVPVRADTSLPAKLPVGRPNDRAELEADQTAERILRNDSVGATSDLRNGVPGRGDVEGVRVHTDGRAAASALAVGARAYAVGRHIVFAPGEYAPHTGRGQSLLAHELAHVAQQARSPGGPVLRRRGGTFGGFVFNILRAIPGFFGLEPGYDNDTLQAYLKVLDDTRQIEDDFDSDNKARAVVERWVRGDARYILPVRRKVLLIKQLLSGFTGDDDEQAILALLRGSTDAELSTILSEVGEQSLHSALHFAEQTQLDQLLKARRPGVDREAAAAKAETGSAAIPEVFPAETVLEAQRRFSTNAQLEKHIRKNCIEIVREMAPVLLGMDPKLAAGATKELGKLKGATLTMEHAMNALTKLGGATGPTVIKFNNGNGNQATAPTEMIGTKAWDTIIAQVGNVPGWHIFGLALFDGYHSVTVFVDNRADGPRLYWADQWAIGPGRISSKRPARCRASAVTRKRASTTGLRNSPRPVGTRSIARSPSAARPIRRTGKRRVGTTLRC